MIGFSYKIWFRSLGCQHLLQLSYSVFLVMFILQRSIPHNRIIHLTLIQLVNKINFLLLNCPQFVLQHFHLYVQLFIKLSHRSHHYLLAFGILNGWYVLLQYFHSLIQSLYLHLVFCTTNIQLLNDCSWLVSLHQLQQLSYYRLLSLKLDRKKQ